jgi:cyanophycinase
MKSRVLMALGGAVAHNPPGPVLKAFLEQAGGPEAEIVIVPTASARAEAGEEFVAAFQALGQISPARILPIRERGDAHQPMHLAALRAASGIFITGGNQVRLSATFGGTPAERELVAAYARGAVIGGTSAGAAILSAVMLAFGEDGPTPRQGLAQFSAGFGLSRRIIFDQHFRQRDRLGRLLFAVAQHPGLLGVGVDENTAALVTDDACLTVIGEHAVTVVDGVDLAATDVADVAPGRPVALSGAQVHVLTAGCTFDLQTRTAVIPRQQLMME